MGMDVDDEDNTQKAIEVEDYDLEVDFSLLEDDERQVRYKTSNISSGPHCLSRMVQLMLVPNSMARLPNSTRTSNAWLLI